MQGAAQVTKALSLLRPTDLPCFHKKTGFSCVVCLGLKKGGTPRGYVRQPVKYTFRLVRLWYPHLAVLKTDDDRLLFKGMSLYHYHSSICARPIIGNLLTVHNMAQVSLVLTGL